MNFRGEDTADGPLDTFTLMTALGALTTRTRLAWAMLNLSFRPPAVLAKMLATLDQITHGRVICTVGSGWFQAEYEAYDLRFFEDHDERVAYAGEVIRLIKELWTHPAPERVTFDGKYARVRSLPFNPAPYQQPHPHIWIGGDSDATLALVKELADGWVTLSSGDPETLARLRAAPDWPRRPLTIVKNAQVFVDETRQAALDTSGRAYEQARATPNPRVPPTFEAFLAREVVGTADECLARLSEIEATGVTYLRLNFPNEEAQERVARLLLPRLAETRAGLLPAC